MQKQRVRAVVVGSGSGGKTAAQELARGGCDVTIVESGRVGGECPYTACVPSKALLLAGREGLSWDDAVAVREEVVDGRDDEAAVKALQEDGVRLVRGHGSLAGKKVVEVTYEGGATERLEADVVVLATGSEPAVPPVEGLEDVPRWTSDQALSAFDRPGSLVVLGGGAVGCELAQAFANFGTEVTLVETADGLLPSEEPFIGALLAEAFGNDGIEVLTGVTAERAEKTPQGLRLHLDDGTHVDAERVLAAGGRKARTEGIGLDELGIEPGDDGRLVVDARCRMATKDGATLDWLFAVGDLTHDSSYTHSANAQARVVAAHVSGQGVDVNLDGTPRVVFTEPSVWCSGATRANAAKGTRYAETDLSDVERGTVLDAVRRKAGKRAAIGRVAVLADGGGRLTGAAVIGPMADSWAGELGGAIHRGATVAELLDAQRGFLTWSEAVTAVLGELE